MWKTDQLGLAVWEVEDSSSWHFDLRGGEYGIAMVAPSQGPTHSLSVDERYVSLRPVDEHPLPLASEQYVRGDRLFINYPQGDGRYALRLILKPIEAQSKRLVLEATVSIQTDLLDSHPMLNLVAEGDQIQSYSQESAGEDWRATVATRATGAPCISIVRGRSTSMAVLLGLHDSPFTSDLSSDTRLCLRLFGDFLEKGVIRTAMPWIVVDRAGDRSLAEPSFDEQLRVWYQQLSERPLPLSS